MSPTSSEAVHSCEPPTDFSLPRKVVQRTWYRTFFLLGLLSLMVIAASMTLYHRALTKYEGALAQLERVQQAHGWVADVRLELVGLNAPGNDVFQSRDVPRERTRLRSAEAQMRRLLDDRPPVLPRDLSRFTGHVTRMRDKAVAIFEKLEAAFSAGADPQESTALLHEASAIMADMDRSQADTMAELSLAEQSLLKRDNDLLTQYRHDLNRIVSIEKYVLLAVVACLAAVFWYGQKLRKTHERLMIQHQRAIEQRHERLAAVGQVCSAVAHGIRNPLAAIMSSAELALDYGTLDEATRLRLRDVLTEGKRLDRRVTRLLDFSRVPTRSFERYDMTAVVDQAVHEIQGTLDRADIQVVTEHRSGPQQVYGDPERMAQSVIEVISNSIDHLDQGGRLRIVTDRASDPPDHVSVSVIDDGPGIPDHLRPRIFDLFFTTKADGNGIGLAFVKHTAELHGGNVSALPSEGRGAHIQFVVPLA